MNQREAIIVPSFDNAIFTIILVVLCIIIRFGIIDGTELTFSSEKAALLQKRLSAAR